MTTHELRMVDGEEKKVPRKVWTVEMFMSLVPTCTPEIATTILNSGVNPDQYIRALKSIEIFCNVSAIFTSQNMLDLFLQRPDSFVQLANTAGISTRVAFDAIKLDPIFNLFNRDPQLVLDCFKRIADSTSGSPTAAFLALCAPQIAASFAEDPQNITDCFVRIATAAGPSSTDAFIALSSSSIPNSFASDPTRTTNYMIQIAEESGSNAGPVYASLSYNYLAGPFENIDIPVPMLTQISTAVVATPLQAYDILSRTLPSSFTDYSGGKVSRDSLLLSIFSSDDLACAIGNPLDFFHAETEKRAQYLSSLSDIQVFALLLSDPDNFFTSSNHMLFDRFKKYLTASGKSVSEIFDEYHVPENLRINFLFRAITYGRLYGNSDSLLTTDDLEKLLPVLMVPLANNRFIPSYYFLLANSISLLSDSDDMRVVINGFKEKLSDRYMGVLAKTDPLTNDEREICAAIEVLLASIDPSTPLVSDENKGKMAALNEKGYFDPNLYRDIDGKLLIVQVFDKEDTQDEHWQLTQTWFRRYAMPRVGDEGELIYETPTTRVILYMGDNDEANQQFVRNTLTQTPNALLTFRGHAYSLANNFPYDIFSDAGHVLFIPGSCGSAGRIANYVFANPDIDLRFFSNTSTGRGQVTNALLSALINSNERIPFRDLLKKAEDQIIANGGDPKTIYAWMAGESLLAYVNTIRSS